MRTGIDEDTSDTHMHEKGTVPPITLYANFKFNSKMAQNTFKLHFDIVLRITDIHFKS